MAQLRSNIAYAPPDDLTRDRFSFFPALLPISQVGLGQGYLELPQVHVPQNKLTQRVLDPKNVYILDCITDIFVWIGKKSTRFVRAAAVKLSQELSNMLDRPKNALITRSVRLR